MKAIQLLTKKENLRISGFGKSFTMLLIISFVCAIPFSVTKALPSYARQTQLSCTACHTSFPELNSFGRQFKANGYTMTSVTTIDEQGDTISPSTRLKLLNNLPVSMMVQTSFTHVSKDVSWQQNNSVLFPQQLSLFLAGQITPHIGSFIQMTYADGAFGMDNADIRYANTVNVGSKSLLYGVTLNNNPTAQDLWNTVPAWRFPYATSPGAPSPAKSTLIENLGGQVAGLGAYGLFNDLVFAEFTAYRSAQQISHTPLDSTDAMVIKGISPYWRLALQHQFGDNYFEIGTFGIASSHYIHGISGALDKFIDVAFDMQYERTLPSGTFTLHTSLTNEKETRDDGMGMLQDYKFQSFKIDGNLFLKNGLGATLGYFNHSGDPDEAAIPSGTFKPNSSGFITQIEYMPWRNTKFAAQYISYLRFDGEKLNYDGEGRNAAHNNTLYLSAWLCF